MAEVYELKAESLSIGALDFGRPELTEQLARALRERRLLVIPLLILFLAAETLVASVFHIAIRQGVANRYAVNLKAGWKGFWGEINLTPPTKPAPPPADPSEE